MKILVLGSHGFIGSRLVFNLISKGHTVFGIDNLNIYVSNYNLKFYFENLELRRKLFLNSLSLFEKFDYQEYIKLNSIINNFKPDVIINLGGNSVADNCKQNTEDAVKSIYLSNSNILEIIKNYSHIKYIFLSSSMVYGDFIKDNVDEESACKPIDPYGSIKLGAELLIKSFSYQFGTKFLIIRPSAVYGPTDANMRVSGIFFYNAFDNKPLKVMNNEEKLDFTYVQDLVDGLVLAIENQTVVNQTFNITAGRSRSIRDFAEILKNINKKINIIYNSNKVEYMPNLKRPIRGTLDISKARKLLNFNPKYSLEDGIKEYYDFYIQYLKNFFYEKNKSL